jgi:hypothetical protein
MDVLSLAGQRKQKMGLGPMKVKVAFCQIPLAMSTTFCGDALSSLEYVCLTALREISVMQESRLINACDCFKHTFVLFFFVLQLQF